jgi:hypothetical protein
VCWGLTQTVLNDGDRFVGTAVVSDLRTSKDVAYKQDCRRHYDLATDGRFTQATYISAKHTFVDYEQLGGGLWLLSGHVIAPLAANGGGDGWPADQVTDVCATPL